MPEEYNTDQPFSSLTDEEVQIIDLQPDRASSIDGSPVSIGLTPRRASRFRFGLLALLLLACLSLVLALLPSLTPSQSVNRPATVPLQSRDQVSYQLYVTDTLVYVYLYSGVLEAITPGGGRVLWRRTVTLQEDPLLFEGALYLHTNAGLEAWRASDYTLLWRRNLTGKFFIQQADQHILYLSQMINSTSSLSFLLDAVRADNGVQLWQVQIRDQPWHIQDGIIYQFAPASNMLEAWNARDDVRIWQHPILTEDQELVGASGIIYLPQGGALDALRISDGAVLWHRNGIVKIIALHQDILYTTSLTGDSVVALRASDGAELWSSKVQDAGHGAASDDKLYVQLLDTHTVLALRASDGAHLWTSASQASGAPIFTTANNILYFDPDVNADVGILSAYRTSDGASLWQIQKNGRVPSVFQGQMVYVVTPDNQELLALNAITGQVRWRNIIA